MPALKTGPLTIAELQAVWEGAVDTGYSDAFKAAGEGRGFEVWTQLFKQLSRASTAIDVTTQAMFISPWSGQTNPPAAGAQQSTVTLKFSRTGYANLGLRLVAGQMFVVEETTDADLQGPQTVRTGRRYQLAENLYFPPGVSGPLEVAAVAEFTGYGYDNPLPDTLVAIEQPGTLFENDFATVTTSTLAADTGGSLRTHAKITAANQADMFVSSHVGQYVLFTAGANSGLVARGDTFFSPAVPVGSGLGLELFYAVSTIAGTGTFQVGELVSIGGGVAVGMIVNDQVVNGTRRIALVGLNGTSGTDAHTGGTTYVVVGSTLLGKTSAATATVTTVDCSTSLASETSAAAWRILDWVDDFGLTVTNEASPTGGKSGMLDELGDERAVNRSPSEEDDDYRIRVREIADVVSPNAVKRALNRALGSLPWTLREVGSANFPGFFFDGDLSVASATPHGSQNDAYDTDVLTFGGTLSGTFQFQEEAVLEETATLARYASGWVGRLSVGDTILDLIRKEGGFPPTWTGMRVRGLVSGAVFTPTTGTNYSATADRKFRTYLDYEQFRGYFLVSVPKFGLGEFGYSYDSGSPYNGYDISADLAPAMDGYPRLNSTIYKRVFAAVDSIRAGGVGFDLVMNVPEDGPLPKEIVLFAGDCSVKTSVFRRASGMVIDVSRFPATIGSLSRNVRFVCDVQKSAGATSVDVQLWDITHDVLVAGSLISHSTDAFLTEIVSGLIGVGSTNGNIRSDGPAMYEVQARMTGGATDVVVITGARLVISYG